MIGANVLDLGHDEVCKALEYYLNNVVLKSPVKVTGLRATTDSYGQDKAVYRVKQSIEFADVVPVEQSESL